MRHKDRCLTALAIANPTYSLSWPLTLLAEVTVNHRVDEGKLRRIRALDVPTLEMRIGFSNTLFSDDAG